MSYVDFDVFQTSLDFLCFRLTAWQWFIQAHVLLRAHFEALKNFDEEPEFDSTQFRVSIWDKEDGHRVVGRRFGRGRRTGGGVSTVYK